MSNKSDPEVSRREFLQAAGSGLALVSTPALALAATAAEADKAAVLAQIPKMHAANLKRLQDWIALPSIAAENRNYPQGPDYMAKLAREAGFTGVEIIPTSGKSGVFGRIDAGARTTLGVYFMYDVKQFVPEEWSSPPLEGRLVKKEGVGTVCMGRGAVNQKGPENSFLSALMAFQGRRQEAAGESGAGVRGRRGNRLAAFPRGGADAEGAGGAEEVRPASSCPRRGRNWTAVCR